jgi:hypothetical protein
MIAASGKGPGMGAKANGITTDGSDMPNMRGAPAGGSSKPGSMAPKKDGRAKVASIVKRFQKI